MSVYSMLMLDDNKNRTSEYWCDSDSLGEDRTDSFDIDSLEIGSPDQALATSSYPPFQITN
jgi:hypothetical protein